MSCQNQPVPISEAEGFAFGWRGAFSAAIHALQSGPALAAEVSSQARVNKLETDNSLRTTAPKPVGQHFRLLRGAEAAALIEFAVALPLLVVLIVGIFDFGGAFNLKQELNNAVREGARFGASQPTNDVSVLILKPPSVNAIRFLVDAYLQTAKINDCGLSSIPEPPQGGGLAWIYTASSGCAGTLTLTISRSVPVPETIGGATVNMLCTQVQISYPYQWHFNSVIQLLVPGANYTFTNITSDATAANMD